MAESDFNGIDRMCMEVDRLNNENANLRRVNKMAMKRLVKLSDLLSDPIVISDGGGRLRPIKNTSRQDIYDTLLKCQYALEIPNRWFPKEWRENDG